MSFAEACIALGAMCAPSTPPPASLRTGFAALILKVVEVSRSK